MVEITLRVVLSLALVGLATAYAGGWRRIRAAGQAPPLWRLASYMLGLTAVAAALLSPLDDVATERFSAHMGQHLLLTMAAAPLLALGNPLPLVLWGLPSRVRRPVAVTLRRRAPLRLALSALTFLPVAGLVHVITVWLWHVPSLYDAAVEHELLHAVEHTTFLATGILFWWPIIQPAPRLWPRPHPGFQILYLLIATAQTTALGMVLAVPEQAFYPHYVRAAAALGISAVDDQLLGAGLMWGGSHMYLLPILLILYGLSRDSERERGDSLG